MNNAIIVEEGCVRQEKGEIAEEVECIIGRDTYEENLAVELQVCLRSV